MRKLIAVAVPLLGAALLVGLVGAAPAPSQKPAAEPKPALATPEKPESTEPPAVKRTRSRRHMDARECLRYPTNMEIHRCSLKYL